MVDSVEKALAGAEEDRGNGQGHLVDQSGLKVVPDRGDAAAKPEVPVAGGVGAQNILTAIDGRGP